MNHLENNLREINALIKSSAEKVGRNFEEITLIAVSKYASTQDALKLSQLGVNDFGENRVAEALKKLEALSPKRVHFIGHLQTNKVNKVVGYFYSIHSLDRIALIEAVEKRARALEIKQKGFVQVNVSGEGSKGGFAVDDISNVVEFLKKCPHLDIQGFMTMAPQDQSEKELREIFKKLKTTSQKYGFPGLSMGMSGDFEIAIEEGATHIRVGSKLFK